MSSFRDHYDKLNDAQKKAVDAIHGPLLVLAGPGTGKTQLLSVRTANILKLEKVGPENILILTFSNAAVFAMRRRLAEIIGTRGYAVEVETFHSFANSIVLESEFAINYVKDKIEISEVEKIRALEYIMDNTKGVEPLRPFGAPYIHRREIEKRISELRNEGISPSRFKEILKNVCPDDVNLEEKHIPRLGALALIYENYEKLKGEGSGRIFDERGRIDYDDMILIALDALGKEPSLKEFFRKQYKFVMVDEFQDTNGAQLELLFSILDGKVPNICCVGDDDQSIYRFQGANLANFRNLKKRIPSIETIELKYNYRSADEIIKLTHSAISLLPGNERISDKNLESRAVFGSAGVRFVEFGAEEEELSFLVEEVKRQAEKIAKDPKLSKEEREKPYNNIAVLLRKRGQILKVIDVFLRAGVPYATDGEEDIRGEKRVRQMLDALELACVDVEDNEKKSLALYKVLSADYMEVPHTDILKLIEFVNKLKLSGKATNLFIEFLAKSCGLPSLDKAARAVERLIEDARTRPVHDILLRYVEDTGLYRYILKKYDREKVLKARDLRSLVAFINMVKESSVSNPAVTLDSFMSDLALREMHSLPITGKIATMSQDGVRLYTAHASKGLEFYTVFLPFCLEKESWPVKRKGETIPLPVDIFQGKEKITDKDELKMMDYYDELRLFYVASTRAKARLIYTATPRDKTVVTRFLTDMGVKSEDGSPRDEEKFLVNFLKRCEERDPFVDASGILKDIVSDLTLNPTSLNNYIACHRKFLYDNVLRLPGKKNQHLAFGSSAHKALEDVYRLYMEKKTFPDFTLFKRSFTRALEFQGVNKEIKTWCLDRLETLKTWYDKKTASPIMPIDLENKIEITLAEGIVFRGAFDKIEEDAKNSIKVIDYKTGKPDKHVKAIQNHCDLSKYECDDYYRQLIAYKMLYERSRAAGEKKTVTKGVLEFLEPVSEDVKKYNLVKGEYKNITVDLTDKMVSELEEVIVKCWRDIQSLKFDKLAERDDSDRCSRCAYDGICWGA